jgi:hypothetical protein
VVSYFPPHRISSSYVSKVTLITLKGYHQVISLPTFQELDFPPWFLDDISIVVILSSDEKRLAASGTVTWSTPGTLTGGKEPAFA